MAFCTRCGTELDAAAKFCSNCGQAVAEADNRPADPETGGRKGAVLFYLFFGALVVLWLAMGMPTDRFWWR